MKTSGSLENYIDHTYCHMNNLTIKPIITKMKYITPMYPSLLPAFIAEIPKNSAPIEIKNEIQLLNIAKIILVITKSNDQIQSLLYPLWSTLFIFPSSIKNQLLCFNSFGCKKISDSLVNIICFSFSIHSSFFAFFSSFFHQEITSHKFYKTRITKLQLKIYQLLNLVNYSRVLNILSIHKLLQEKFLKRKELYKNKIFLPFFYKFSNHYLLSYHTSNKNDLFLLPFLEVTIETKKQ